MDIAQKVIDALENLHPTLKIVIGGIIVIMPFWYLCIYIFAKNILYNSTIEVPIIISFCLTILWFFSFFGLASFLNPPKANEKNEGDSQLYAGIFLGVLVLGFAMLIGYLVKPTFHWFIIFSFGSVWILIAIIQLRNKN
jgi:hypothetical protein